LQQKRPIDILPVMKEEVVEYLALGLSKAKIARRLNKHRSSIGREIERMELKKREVGFQIRK